MWPVWACAALLLTVGPHRASSGKRQVAPRLPELRPTAPAAVRSGSSSPAGHCPSWRRVPQPNLGCGATRPSLSDVTVSCVDDRCALRYCKGLRGSGRATHLMQQQAARARAAAPHQSERSSAIMPRRPACARVSCVCNALVAICCSTRPVLGRSERATGVARWQAVREPAGVCGELRVCYGVVLPQRAAAAAGSRRQPPPPPTRSPAACPSTTAALQPTARHVLLH